MIQQSLSSDAASEVGFYYPQSDEGAVDVVKESRLGFVNEEKQNSGSSFSPHSSSFLLPFFVLVGEGKRFLYLLWFLFLDNLLKHSFEGQKQRYFKNVNQSFFSRYRSSAGNF